MSAALIPIKAPTLYELEDELLALIETGEGGVPEELRGEYEARLEQTFCATRAKRDRVAEFSRYLDSQAELAKAEAKRLSARAADFQIMRERLHSYVKRTMEATGQRKLEGEFSTFNLRKNPARVEITAEVLVPLDYKRHIPERWEPDKMAIKDAIKAGTEVPGAALIAGEDRLEIK